MAQGLADHLGVDAELGQAGLDHVEDLADVDVALGRDRVFPAAFGPWDSTPDSDVP